MKQEHILFPSTSVPWSKPLPLGQFICPFPPGRTITKTPTQPLWHTNKHFLNRAFFEILFIIIIIDINRFLDRCFHASIIEFFFISLVSVQTETRQIKKNSIIEAWKHRSRNLLTASIIFFCRHLRRRKRRQVSLY